MIQGNCGDKRGHIMCNKITFTWVTEGNGAFSRSMLAICSCLDAWFSDSSLSFLSCSEAKTCLATKRVAFVGDSRIRQLFYSFIKIIDPEQKEDGNKVITRTSLT